MYLEIIWQGTAIPGRFLGAPRVWDSQISRKSAHGSGKFVSPRYRSTPPLRRYPC